MIFCALEPGQLSKGLKKDRSALGEIEPWPIRIDVKIENAIHIYGRVLVPGSKLSAIRSIMVIKYPISAKGRMRRNRGKLEHRRFRLAFWKHRVGFKKENLNCF